MDGLFWHFGRQNNWARRGIEKVGQPANCAHIWLFQDARNFQHEGIVSAQELTRAQDMLPQSRGNEFLSHRACLRVLLAVCYLGIKSPRDIGIEITDYGKPWLRDAPGLHFNLSHSHGALAIAVSQNEVGIDIEKIRPISDWRELSKDILAPTEIATIAALPGADHETAFLRCFTARKAYLKAIGTGFSAPALDLPGRQPGRAAHDNRQMLEAALPPLPDLVGMSACGRLDKILLDPQTWQNTI